MKNILRFVVAVSLGVAAMSGQTRSGADVYQEALHLQEVKGDLPAAVALYKTIVERDVSDRRLVASALLQLGSCYEKLGRAEAKQAFERIVR